MSNTLSKFFNRLFGGDQVPVSTSQANPPATAATPEPAMSAAAALVRATTPAATPIATPASAPAVPGTDADSNPQPATVLASVTPAPATAAPHAEKLIAWKPALPIDSLYFDWIMGYPGEGGNFETEQVILQALYKLLASDLNDAVIVPRVPSVVPQLLNSLRSKTISAGELSRQIVKDVVLVGEVINTVNSALYNPADRINSLEKAVMILGEEGLRLVIAKVAFRPIINLNAGQFTRRAAPHIWNQSEKCAVACHTLARNIDPFHAFLTGLMKNVGLIIAFRLLDQTCEQGKFKYSASFQAIFSSVAATLSYRIAQRWEFPDHVVLALQQQAGGSKPIDWSPLGHLLHTADLISKMRLLVNHAQLNSNDKKLRIGLNPDQANCFDLLNEIQLYDTTGVQQQPTQ
ncbi:HDOD domain-containing protein [Undibacterium sp. CY18W]|uniref:HDOD domain-containing protein n=1 Tax=Undibacterium hunanense TaxID=2762292 RepID=A0ABR6ZLN2_9BURK|nr:HDOD domain-containing protein [Undibacterium hunanense]MBC3916810.1 HDOD domain-containing protein [Undibacterium hunanense]